MSEGPSEFLSEFLLTPRIRPSQLRGDGGMAVLAALMASKRGRHTSTQQHNAHNLGSAYYVLVG